MEIRMEKIIKSFSGNVAVNEFSATFEEGELTALLGPSGCGKSTLLNMISGILKPTSGKIYFGGKDVTNVSMEKRGVGMVFQNYALYPHMTALENICFPLEMKKMKKPERIERAKELAELVQITDYLDQKPAQMSGGQQQRVAIARALAKEPAILLLDEPLSNLDARLRLEMREEIRRIQQETKITTIFVTHDQEEAMSISDKIMLMKKGQLMQLDRPQVLYENPSNSFVASFMGNPPICMIPGVKKGNTVVTEAGCEIRYENLDKVPDGKKVLAGVRAEGVAIAKDSESMTAVVREQYMIGRDRMLVAEMGQDIVRLFIDDEEDINTEESVKLKLKKRGNFIFDAETGERYYL